MSDPTAPRHALGTMLGRRGSLVALLLLATSSATAQTTPTELPPSDVPASLQGKWTVTFAGGGTSDVALEPRTATVGPGVAYIAGRFQIEGTMELTVWLTPAALSPPVPGSAWNAALKEKGSTFPGLLPARLTLTYDKAKDEMSGTYHSPEIKYEQPTGKYQSTETASLGIRLNRGPVSRPARGMAGLP